ncbi:MAG: hypothetical protein ACFCVA_12360 [Gammaproteobacteria bacterium]
MVIVSSGLLWNTPLTPKPSAAESLGSKGVCGKDAGPKPIGASSRRPLPQGVGCPKGKGHPAAETMINAYSLPRNRVGEAVDRAKGHPFSGWIARFK